MDDKAFRKLALVFVTVSKAPDAPRSAQAEVPHRPCLPEACQGHSLALARATGGASIFTMHLG